MARSASVSSRRTDCSSSLPPRAPLRAVAPRAFAEEPGHLVDRPRATFAGSTALWQLLTQPEHVVIVDVVLRLVVLLLQSLLLESTASSSEKNSFPPRLDGLSKGGKVALVQKPCISGSPSGVRGGVHF